MVARTMCLGRILWQPEYVGAEFLYLIRNRKEKAKDRGRGGAKGKERNRNRRKWWWWGRSQGYEAPQPWSKGLHLVICFFQISLSSP